MTENIEFEWDEKKNQSNIKKHNLSFDEATAIFENPVVTIIDERFDYGEVRKVSYGKLRSAGIFTVIYTVRDNKYRIISARKSKQKERKIYDKNIKKKT